MRRMAKREPEPLIPLDKLKEVIRGLIRVPKDEIDKAEVDRQKRPKAPPQPRQPSP